MTSDVPRSWQWVIAGVVGGVLLITLLVTAGSGDGRDGRDRDESTMAEVMCEDFVEKRLKSPASAEFTNPRTVRSPEGVYTVTGDVDSQNSFGAMIRNRYQCKVSHEGDTWHLADLTFTER